MSELQAYWPDIDTGNASFANIVRPWCKDRWKEGKRLAISIVEAEDAKSDQQRRYYHGVVLTEIAEQAKANGQKFAMPVWKEFFRDKFLGFKVKTFTNPVTGKKSRRRVRISTEDLGVKAYSNLIERVTAFAVTDLGVEFSVAKWEEYR